MTQEKGEITKADAKKAWQKLELKQFDVPSSTQTGNMRLDPAENFVFYRPS